jgi:hypothetical protein
MEQTDGAVQHMTTPEVPIDNAQNTEESDPAEDAPSNATSDG